ncbi:hypothetical protein [Vineibacter terrae]|uniref:hypothetical protein n=1 Tax=Vineibacter terrae TaxID=2586908 RepID=UPI002E30A77F|nr:hypothetical protein [Vineibacter terrae]HEX2886312.1 hypothetical protein [Vineibacter terrae]
MTLHPTPAVNHVPPNQRAGRWDLIKGVKNPFHDATDKASFEYWFNYFWEEARQSDDLAEGDKARLCDAFYAVLSRVGSDPSRTSGPKWTSVGKLSKLDDDRRRQILNTLLVMGFKRVALNGILSSSSAGVHAERAMDARAIFTKNNIASEQGGTSRSIAIGFRADRRTYEDLAQQGGFHSRARSFGQKVYDDFGLNKPWHPLSLPVYQNSLFLRKGINKDNCLHTVVSVAKVFSEIMPYPLLSDTSIFPLAFKPFSQWTESDKTTAATSWLKVKAVEIGDPPKIHHLDNEIRVFMVRVDNEKVRAYDTEAWQKRLGGANPFPEAAVTHIPIEDILAEIVIVRKYFFDNGVVSLYDIEFTGCRLLPSRAYLAQVHGLGFPEKLQAMIQGLEVAARSAFSDARARFRAQGKPPPPAGRARPRWTCPRCGVTMLEVQKRAHACAT